MNEIKATTETKTFNNMANQYTERAERLKMLNEKLYHIIKRLTGEIKVKNEPDKGGLDMIEPSFYDIMQKNLIEFSESLEEITNHLDKLEEYI